LKEIKPASVKRIQVFFICLISAAVLWSCTSYTPKPLDQTEFISQAQTQEKENVRVSAEVLSADETVSVFGLPLYKKGIQPVWLQIENKTQDRLWFPPASLDRDYFAPYEVAYMHHSGFKKESKNKMDVFFHDSVITHIIDPGEIQSGFIFTNLELGTKAFNVDILGANRVLDFTFLVPVAGLQVDHREVDWDTLTENTEKNILKNTDQLKQTLVKLPSHTTGEDPEILADPINIVIIGTPEDVLYALLRSSWDETASTSSYQPSKHSPWEIRYQPVQSLYLFGRPQDAAFRKSRSTLNERNQLRLWMSPFSFEGKHVFTGQISRIIRRSSREIFKLEPDVDEARIYLLQNLLYAQTVSKFGYVRKTETATLNNPQQSLGNDTYFTDGLCLVVWISGEPVPLSGVEYMDWEIPIQERRKMLLGE